MAKRQSDMIEIQLAPKSHKKKRLLDDLMKQLEANLNTEKKPCTA